MKILQVSHAFPPHGRGGAERHAWLLARQLAYRDQVAVFHRVADPAEAEYATKRDDLDGIPIWRINNTFRNQKTFADTYRSGAIANAFGRVLDEWRPEVVHFHHFTCLSTTLPEECSRRGIPCVLTLHDYWLLCQRGQLIDRDLRQCAGPSARRCGACLREQVELSAGRGLAGWARRGSVLRARTRHIRAMAGYVSTFITPSRYLSTVFAEAGWPTERFVVLPYGFDKTALRKEKSPSREIRFGFVGSVTFSKGAAIAVRAFRQVEGEGIRLTIHGGYEPYHGREGYLDELRALIASDSRIRLAGPFDYADVGDIFSQIDVLLFPSIWPENAPLTIQEAYLSGTPVVASDYGALPESVERDRGGKLFPVNDATDLARIISEIRDDPSSIDEMRRNLPEVVSIEESAAAIRRVYEQACAG